MRAFQPIARRMEAERNRNLWVPPRALQRIAQCILLGTVVYQFIIGCRMMLYLLAVQNNAAYELSHKWPGSPFQAVALGVMFSSMPFVISRGPRPTKNHAVDPALSILPR
jgi:hypothetical protein